MAGQITREEFVQVTEHRPWGSFTVLADEPDHKVKRIVVKPGQRLSLQRHKHRQEHWLIVSGEAVVTLDDNLVTLALARQWILLVVRSTAWKIKVKSHWCLLKFNWEIILARTI